MDGLILEGGLPYRPLAFLVFFYPHPLHLRSYVHLGSQTFIQVIEVLSILLGRDLVYPTRITAFSRTAGLSTDYKEQDLGAQYTAWI
ncbi:MAG: hypothetical protein V3W17_08280 [Desulfobacteria bacterium]